MKCQHCKYEWEYTGEGKGFYTSCPRCHYKVRIKKNIVGVKYPSKEDIIKCNKVMLERIKVNKADTPKLLSLEKLDDALEYCENATGDLYDKAVYLLKKIIRNHPFASGNRRTAFAITGMFLKDNGLRLNVDDIDKESGILQGIREGYYSDKEIKNWLKNGRIRIFERT